MKKISFFALALAAGLMMGCSDEVGNDVNPGGTGSATVGEGFMSVAINLPSTNGSRASVSGFDDGLPAEYAVKNGKLFIFGGASEATATLQAIYTLDVSDPWTDASGQITTTKTIAVSTTDMTGPNFYALVVLNDNSQDLGLTIGTSKISNLEAKTLAPASETTLRTNGFMMTNSPLSKVAGGTSLPSGVTIMKYPSFDKTKIKSNAADAMLDPAATIYVERIHAKVTLSEDQSMSSPSNALGTMDILGWALDNTNKSTYLMRNVKADDLWWAYKNTKAGTVYRFIEDDPVAEGLYRTYWCTDPNYDSYAAGNFNTISDADLKTTFGAANPQYCLENTFNTDNQKEQSTTAVIVKAQFHDGQDFYTINGSYTTIYDAAAIQALVKTECINYIQDNCSDWYSGTTAIDGDDLEVTLSTTAGAVTATAITFTDPGVTWNPSHNAAEMQTTITAQLSEFNKALTNVKLYKSGVAYYRVLIKHFGDADTPWAEADKSGTDSYPDAAGGVTGENQWLGRYGMVRNNWYDLTVTGARELGSPTIPVATGSWDDDVNNLAVTINILSWAKRTQNVEL